MKKLPLGTKIRATHDLAPWQRKYSSVPKNTIGTITAVGPDASVGWYGMIFDGDIPYAGFVGTTHDACAEVMP